VDGHHLVGAENGFRLALEPTMANKLAGKTDVVFGARSEDIRLVSGGAEEADLQGVIAVREPLGDETIYEVEIAEDYRLLAKTPPRQMYRPGDRVGLVINHQRIHVFDKSTGQRVN
jgi:ABC-type sugar transport system ATPase subunit